jgi:carboxymethylenebutenolidase
MRNVRTDWIEVNSADGGAFKAYLALPPALKGPGVLLIQEIFGVNSHIRGVAEQYALDGFVVLAPDLFWRQQPGVDLGYSDMDVKRGMVMRQRMDFDLALGDLAATARALRVHPDCTGNIAALGYCLGGLLAYLCAADALVDAAVCYYGRIQSRLDRASEVRCPTHMHFAERDDSISQDDVRRIRESFGADQPVKIDTYPDTQHGFNCWDRGAYAPMPAALARGRSLQFLARTIGSQS